ncbi:MAG: ubiquitin-like protein Pup [Acidimicrobiia bacterium]|jgi:ubiquitin-like protein Pup|nr:MAG: ubiquitin-like protein Pup [Acidimicrobiia bacterium]
MTDREHVRRTDDAEVREESEETPSVAADTSEVDDLLDEIDTVLEENAEEFVRNYVQKGGQ